MNPSEEIKKRQNKTYSEIGELSYQRYKLVKQAESCQKQVAEIDEAIATREAMLNECDRSRKDFDAYLAIQEGALTMDQIQQSVTTGADITTPPEATKT